MRFFVTLLAALALSAQFARAQVANEETEDAPAPDMICSDDAISPVVIVHNVDEIFAAGQLQQSYSFLDYHFERDGRYLRARAYLDGAKTVTIFGPFQSGDDLTPVSDDGFKGEVTAYLKRRYSRIEETAGDDEIRSVWEWREDETPDLSGCAPIIHDAE